MSSASPAEAPKLLSLSIYSVPSTSGSASAAEPTAELRAIAIDVSSFGWLQRNTVSDFLKLTSSIVAARTEEGARECVVKDGNNLFVRRKSNIVVVAVANLAYPKSAAIGMLENIWEKFTEKYPVGRQAGLSPGLLPFPELDELLVKCQDPSQATAIGRIQQELDETKAVLTKTIDQVLQRGEKLDTLVERSNELSSTSKMFYKTAKKQNGCCTIM